jgi:hypothetical protein
MLLFIVIGIAIAYAALAGLLWLIRQSADRRRMEDLVFLQMLVPKKESKEDKEVESEQFSSGKDFREVLGVMDHLCQSLHGLWNGSMSRHWKGQNFFSLEYAALAGEILFFVVRPRRISPLIEKQVTSFYPDAIIDEVEDYDIFTEKSVVAAKMLVPSKSYRSVFKTYQQLKSDPLNNITNAFSKLAISEGAAVQFVLKPARSGWQKKLQE